MIQPMEKIDGNWILARLDNKRGEKARLARALGIDQSMMSRILNGEREIQQDELPKVLTFFGVQLVSDGVVLTGEDRLFWDQFQAMSPDEQDAVRILVTRGALQKDDDKSE